MFDGKPRKRADGRWELQITIGRDENGHRIRKSFYGSKEKEVKKKKDIWIKQNHDKPQDIVEDNDIITFGEWADKWLESKKMTVRAYTYQNTYYTRVQKYLKPYFGNRALDAINQMDIQGFFNNHRDLSEATLKTLKTILSNMFEVAIINDLCYKNPVTNIKIKSLKQKTEKHSFNSSQQRRAMNWCIENEQYDVLTVLKTGMRRGEILGLRWQDIDFNKKIINVRQSYCDPIEYGEAPDLALKSKCSYRSIPIDGELTDCLQKVDHIGERVFPYITAKAYGSHISHVLKRMSKECKLPYLTLHELRHTFGTVLREKGVDLYTISKLMGHASVGVTASIYIHNDIEVLRNAMKIN